MANEIKDYGEIFCQAVDNIIKERLSNIHFDQTILCTVIEDKDKAQGKYIVAYEGAKFEAYSLSITYSKNDEVYVQIPSGDWNEQKLIVSKKTKDSKVSVTYQYPFDNYIDITGNVIKNTSEMKDSLIANGDTGNIILWSYNIDDNYDTKVVETGTEFSQYTRLGIQGQFQSWLKNFNAVSGSYGLELRVQAEKEDITEGNEETEDDENIYYKFFLDAKDMIGDPYNFDTYFQQEKLFDISDIPKIKKMELSFYQNGDFKNQNNEFIQSLQFFEAVDINTSLFGTNENNYYYYDSENHMYIKCSNEESYDPELTYYLGYGDPNLFIKDVYISFGYDTNDFENDIVKIYSFGSPKYSANIFPPENNHRKIDLRWVHDYNNKLVSIDSEKYLDYTITWYRHQLGAYSHTAQSGADWVPLSSQSVINGETNVDIIDADWYLYNENAEDGKYREPGFNYTWLIPDITLAEEKIKAILSYEIDGKTTYLQSNILTFSNREEVQSMPTTDSVSALSITCEDETNGNYYMYGQNAGLLDGSQSGMERIFKVHLKGAELESAESVSWTIPTTHTMIDLEDSYYGAERDFTSKPGHVTITRYGNKHDENIPYNVKANSANIQKYKIKGYYTPDQDNNTIQCKVVRNGITYTATKQLSFGTAGTNGSEYTLFLELSNNVHAIPCVTKAQEFDTDIVKQNGYEVVAHLYNYSNKEIEVNALNNYFIKWEWLINSSHLKLKINDESESFTNIIEYAQPPIQPVNGKLTKEQEELAKNYLTMNELYILKATLSWRGESTEVEEDENGNISNSMREIQKLEAYLPIPIYQYQDKQQFGSGDAATYRNLQPSHIAGATQVLYSSDGYPQYYKDPYKLYFTEYIQQGTAKIKNGTTENKDIDWEIYPKATDATKKYYPTLTEDNRLQPVNIYIKNADIYSIRATKNKKLIWTQPILVLQNRYPNSAVNAWDGKTLTIDKETGIILSTAIAAGKKESDNSFTGVMLGEWGEGNDVEKSISSTTGVYGFNKGAMSYAFKDDGTAFIGKSGHGRILFDGNKGEIKSAAWDDSNMATGLYMDLDDGIIRLQSGEGYVKINSDAVNSSNYRNYYLYGPSYSKVTGTKNTYTFYYYLTKVHQDINSNDDFEKLKNKLYVCYDNYKKISSTKFSSTTKYYTISYEKVNELHMTDTNTDEEISIAQSIFDANRTKYFIKKTTNSKVSYIRVTAKQAYTKNTEYYLLVGTYCNDITETNFKDKKNDLYTKEIVYKSLKNETTYTWSKYEEYFIESYELYTGDATKASIALYTKSISYYLANTYNSLETYYSKIREDKRYITLSAAESEIPLSIGTDSSVGERKFRVNWDGNLYAEDAYLEGEINAGKGYIGGWEISGSTLFQGKVKLDAAKQTISGAIIDGGTINGSKIYADTVTVGSADVYRYSIWEKQANGDHKDTGEVIDSASQLHVDDVTNTYFPYINKDGSVGWRTYVFKEKISKEKMAYIGSFKGAIITGPGGSTSDSTVVGIQSSTTPLVFETTSSVEGQGHLRLTSTENLYLQSAKTIYLVQKTNNAFSNNSARIEINLASAGTKINFKNIPAEQQEGIYARFA